MFSRHHHRSVLMSHAVPLLWLPVQHSLFMHANVAWYSQCFDSVFFSPSPFCTFLLWFPFCIQVYCQSWRGRTHTHVKANTRTAQLSHYLILTVVSHPNECLNKIFSSRQTCVQTFAFLFFLSSICCVGGREKHFCSFLPSANTHTVFSLSCTQTLTVVQNPYLHTHIHRAHLTPTSRSNEEG